jgi:Protein of unknown function (DUF3152)
MRSQRMIVVAAVAALVIAMAGCSSRATAASGTWVAAPSTSPASAPPSSPPISSAPAAPIPSPSMSPSAKPKPSPSASRKPKPKPSPSHSPSPSPSPVSNQCVKPRHGTFTVASGGSPVAGSGGTLYHYEVQVQTGIGQSTSAFAAAVDAILAGKQGWTDSGTREFQRVTGPTCDFVVELASATTSKQICAGYGVSTDGTVSCRGQREVVINVDRWLNGDPDTAWDGHLDVYRDLVIDHEVGHFLGYNHMKCGGDGLPLPVMATPYYDGLQGCVINGWPYDDTGTFISGPPQT